MVFWIFKESFQINTLLWLLPILAVWKIKKAEEYRSSAKHFIACFFQKNRFSSLSNPCGIRHDTVSDMICFFISTLIAMIRQDASPVVLDPHVCELIAGKSAGTKCLSEAVTEIDRRAFIVDDMPTISFPTFWTCLGRILPEKCHDYVRSLFAEIPLEQYGEGLVVPGFVNKLFRIHNCRSDSGACCSFCPSHPSGSD